MTDSNSSKCLQSWKVVEEGVKHCEDHGAYESKLMRHVHPQNPAWWTRCPGCNEVYEKESNELWHRLNSNSSEADRIITLRRDVASIPRRYWSADIRTWEPVYPEMKSVAQVVNDYCSSFEIVIEQGQGLIFTGNPGTGKTHVACAIANHVLSKGGTALYTTATDFLIRLRNTYKKDSDESERQVYEAFQSPDLLVVDEIGRSQETEHSVSSIFHMIDKRYRELRPTILVTNMDRDRAKAFLGEALISRFREGGGKMLGFAWPDLRTIKRGD